MILTCFFLHWPSQHLVIWVRRHLFSVFRGEETKVPSKVTCLPDCTPDWLVSSVLSINICWLNRQIRTGVQSPCSLLQCFATKLSWVPWGHSGSIFRIGWFLLTFPLGFPHSIAGCTLQRPSSQLCSLQSGKTKITPPTVILFLLLVFWDLHIIADKSDS